MCYVNVRRTTKKFKAYRRHTGLSVCDLYENEREYKIDVRGSNSSLISFALV